MTFYKPMLQKLWKKILQQVWEVYGCFNMIVYDIRWMTGGWCVAPGRQGGRGLMMCKEDIIGCTLSQVHHLSSSGLGDMVILQWRSSCFHVGTWYDLIILGDAILAVPSTVPIELNIFYGLSGDWSMAAKLRLERFRCRLAMVIRLISVQRLLQQKEPPPLPHHNNKTTATTTATSTTTTPTTPHYHHPHYHHHRHHHHDKTSPFVLIEGPLSHSPWWLEAGRWHSAVQWCTWQCHGTMNHSWWIWMDVVPPDDFGSRNDSQSIIV